MSSWDYRLIESVDGFDLHEVYFNEQQQIEGWTAYPIALKDLADDEKKEYFLAWSDALHRPLIKLHSSEDKQELIESDFVPVENDRHVCRLYPDLTAIFSRHADIEKVWCYQGKLLLKCTNEELEAIEVLNNLSIDLSASLPNLKFDLALSDSLPENSEDRLIYLHGKWNNEHFMKLKILKQLEHIEQQYQVDILNACESGSRAWGFESADSDFDVRFIYVHPRDWYLQIDAERQRDVIELPINDLLDINGWDLKKALNLLYKSNPVLLEWLSSPIVYRQNPNFIQAISPLLKNYFSPQKTFYHYFHMAKGNYREYFKGDQVRLKKYLYVLRPLLAIDWILRYQQPIPMRFSELVKECVQDKALLDAIEHLLWLKSLGSEKAYGNPIPILNDWIEEKIDQFEQLKPDSLPYTDIEPLNQLFLQQLWYHKMGSETNEYYHQL